MNFWVLSVIGLNFSNYERKVLFWNIIEDGMMVVIGFFKSFMFCLLCVYIDDKFFLL